MTFVPVALFWMLAIPLFLGPPQRLVAFLFAVLPFGAVAVIPTQATGGLTLTPAPVVGLLIIARMFLTRGGLNYALTAALTPHRMTLLFGMLVTAWLTTIFMPRLLARQIDIIPVRGILQKTSPLVPTTQNLSQLIYVTSSILATVAFAFLLRSPAMRQSALKALCLGAAVAVGTGILDFMSQYLPLGPLLAPFRTATYALATDVEVLGGKRVVGLTPEASAYGGMCLGLLTSLYFMRGAIAARTLRDVYAPILIVMLVLMIWLAKSTSAYIGLGLALSLAGARWIQRARTRHGASERAGLRTEFIVAFGALLMLVLVMLVRPGTLDPFYAMIDRMVLSKADSTSYEERGMWRAVSYQAFLDSGLIGIGIGSTRASSNLVSLLSSIGIVGTACYLGFLVQSMLRRAAPDDPQGREVIRGFRWSLAPGLVVGFFTGTADFGILGAFRFGLVTAVGLQSPGRGDAVRATPPGRPDAPAPLGGRPVEAS